MNGCNKLKEVFVMKTKDLPEITYALYEKLVHDLLDFDVWI